MRTLFRSLLLLSLFFVGALYPTALIDREGEEEGVPLSLPEEIGIGARLCIFAFLIPIQKLGVKLEETLWTMI